MRSIFSQLLALGPELVAFILTTAILSPRGALAVSPVPVPSPYLDLDNLGRVALAGDFDSISLYTYEGQSENALSKNGSQALLQQFPGGSFQTLGMSDAYMESMCAFIAGGKLQGVVLGGNFTSIDGMEAQTAALWNPATGEFSPLPGLDGAVYTVFCDASRNTVFFGGLFSAPGAMNAMAWVTNWTALPFAGFNGPVNSITMNSKGNLVFGGNFDGLGNMTVSSGQLNSQVIPLSSGTITAAGTTTTMFGFESPSNIICKVGQDGPGSTWLLEDGIPGWWQGTYGFGYNPTKLRLYNTAYQGRGTKEWHFENMNSGGVPNLVYMDADGKNQSCSSVCPLNPSNGTGSYQDFYFVPSVGMSEFRIWVTDWYGAGGGLAGIEMFQDDLYSFAVQDFNEPRCDDVSTGSTSTANPPNTWFQVANNGTSSSDWLETNLNQSQWNSSQLAASINVVFQPNIQQSGNYSVLMYTPGCIPDNSCANRGIVNVTGTMTTNGPPITTTVYQNNDYDKFDQIYYGFVDVTSDSFRPEFTLSPSSLQQPGQQTLTVVAQRIRFDIVSSTGGLNGLYEYDPNDASLTSNFANSAIDTAGTKLNDGATVRTLISFEDDMYVGGMFSGDGISNIMVVDTAAAPLTDGGLNDAVNDMYRDGTTLYAAGNFSNTADSSMTGLNNIAAYDTASKKWSALGAGVNGPVSSLVELSINVTNGGNLQQCIAVTGSFTQINGYGDNDAYNVSGFAVWVLSANDWLSNIPSATVALQGDLVTMTNVPGYQPVYAGEISSQTLGLSDAVELTAGSSDSLSLQSFGIKVDPSSNSPGASSKVKREVSSTQNYSGVYTGLYYGDNNLNITVLGGQFSATASNGNTVKNLIFINNTHAQAVAGISGLDSASTVAAVATYGTVLYAGGSLTGTVNGNSINGLVAYDMMAAAPVSPQPPSLNGNNVVINAIAAQPDSSDVYFGGNFAYAGSLPCATLCYYDASIQQWNTPGSSLSGTITTMFWSSNTQLILAGNLQLAGNKTFMATYDSKTQALTAWPGASDLPGPISTLSAVDSSYSEFWAAGTASNNGSAYLAYYGNNNAWTSVAGLGAATTIRSLQLLDVSSNHVSTSLVPEDKVLMVVGNIALPQFGNASAALFNGTDFVPFLLTNKDDGSQGSISTIFVSNPNGLLNVSSHHLALGLIVLIGLAIALGLICIIIAAGLLMERQRRRNQGYVPMPAVTEKNSAFSRVPPETLFVAMKEKGAAPKV